MNQVHNKPIEPIFRGFEYNSKLVRYLDWHLVGLLKRDVNDADVHDEDDHQSADDHSCVSEKTRKNGKYADKDEVHQIVADVSLKELVHFLQLDVHIVVIVDQSRQLSIVDEFLRSVQAFYLLADEMELPREEA